MSGAMVDVSSRQLHVVFALGYESASKATRVAT